MRNILNLLICKRIILFKFIILSLIISFCGCSTSTNYFLPKKDLIGELESLVYKKNLIESSQSIQNIKAIARTQLVTSYGKDSFRYVIALRHPKDIRIEIMPVNTAYTLAQFTSYNGKAYFIDSTEKKVYEGSSAEDFLKLFLKLPVQDSDLLPLFAGKIPTRFFEEEKLNFYSTSQMNSIVIESANSLYSWKVDKNTFNVEELVIKEPFKKEAVVIARYTDELEVVGSKSKHIIPQKINLTLPKDNIELVMSVNSPKINTKIEDDLYKVKMPDGFEVVEEK